MREFCVPKTYVTIYKEVFCILDGLVVCASRHPVIGSDLKTLSKATDK